MVLVFQIDFLFYCAKKVFCFYFFSHLEVDRADLHQIPDDVSVALGAADVEGGEAGGVLGVHFRAVLHQQLHAVAR